MIEKEIVDYLMHNRVSTTEVADVLGKAGALEGVHAMNRGHYQAGIIKWVYAYDETNWPIHEQIEDIPEGRIILADGFNCNNRALFGELVSKYLLLYKQSKAIVVRGNLRDAAELYRENYPIWCTGLTPIGCYNVKPSKSYDEKVITEYKSQYDGAIAICDDCGCVVIPKNRIDEQMLNDLHRIENQEDIWKDRLNHYKESTFKIVCEKEYLKDEVYMGRRNIIETIEKKKQPEN